MYRERGREEGGGPIAVGCMAIRVRSRYATLGKRKVKRDKGRGIEETEIHGQKKIKGERDRDGEEKRKKDL